MTPSSHETFKWHSTVVSVKTRHRVVNCNFTTVSWRPTEKCDQHFFTDDYSTRTLTKYRSHLTHHFGRGVFHRQKCPCQLDSSNKTSPCSCYRFPCSAIVAKEAMLMTNCTVSEVFALSDEENSQEHVTHVDAYQFKPPVGHLLE